MILILIPLESQHVGMRIYANTQILFRAKDIAQKPSFLSFLAITIAVRQTELLLILIPLQNEHVGMGICAKHTNFIQNERYCSSFLSFLAITIALRQTEVLLILIPLQNEHVGMGICAKHKFYSERKILLFIFVVFGYNNCSASNPNDFNTHTS